jgi:hypothetical protein
MAKTEMMKLRLRPDEKTAFEEAADLAGISVSAWVRERLRAACIRELEGAGLKVPFVRQLTMSNTDG